MRIALINPFSCGKLHFLHSTLLIIPRNFLRRGLTRRMQREEQSGYATAGENKRSPEEWRPRGRYSEQIRPLFSVL